MDSLSYSWPIATWWAQLKSRIGARLKVPSPVEMDLEIDYGASADTGMAHVTVVATDAITYSNLRLYLGIVEDGLWGVDHTCNQVLRKYEPSWVGLPFSIALGDTFTHDEEFVLSELWVEENCHMVAWVQDGPPTYHVLQSIQSPMYFPVPEEITALTIELAQSDLRLQWPAVTTDTRGHPLAVDGYHVYRDTVAVRDPGSDPFAATTNTYYLDDSGVVGDVGTQYYYWVMAIAGDREAAESNGVGEFDIVVNTAK